MGPALTLWIVQGVVSYFAIALVLGPVESLRAWVLAGFYYGLLVLPLGVLLLVLDSLTGKVRTIANVFGPTFFGMGRIALGPIIVGFLYCSAQGLEFGERPSFFVFDKESSRFAAAAAAGGLVIFWSEFTLAIGYPPRGSLSRREEYLWRGHWVFIVFAAWAAVVSYGFPELFYLVAWGAAILPLIVLVLRMYRLARETYRDAFEAKEADLGSLIAAPWCVHWTDVHLTEPGNKQAEGGTGGNAYLEEWIASARELSPSYAFITGDLVDKGLEEEWRVARTLLKPLRDDGCRILVVPGNHDLLVPYSEDSILAVLFRFTVPSLSHSLNGVRLGRYLDFASEMDSGIELHNGRKLTEVLCKDREVFDSLWRLVEKAKKDLDSRPQEKVLTELDGEAQKLFPASGPVGSWMDLLADSNRERFIPEVRGAWYSRYWYGYFPMKVVDKKTKTPIFILNSVPDDLTLLGSAWGFFGQEQIERFARMLGEDKSPQVIVLAHHAPFKWKKYELAPKLRWGDIQRWACLATAKPEAKALEEILSTHVQQGREITLFCGHRHGGKEHQPRFGVWSGGRILEGASLTKPAVPVVGLAWDRAGKILTGLIALAKRHEETGERRCSLVRPDERGSAPRGGSP